MMDGWTEEMLRKAASWQSFKEGRGLFERGLADASPTADGWMGSVRVGTRPLRVKVVARSATDITASCPCSVNRATGEVCAHAVATGLAVLAGSAAPVVPSEPAASSEPAKSAVAFDVKLSAKWREQLQRGVLACSVAVRDSEQASEADAKLAAWLAARGVKVGRSPAQLSLRGGLADEFLGLLVGHPAVADPDGSLELSQGARILLKSADLATDGCHALLIPAESSAWLLVSEMPWFSQGRELVRVGQGCPPDGLAVRLAELASGRSAMVEIGRLLAHLETWQDWLSFPDECWLASLHFVSAPSRVVLTLGGGLDAITASLAVHYEDAAPVIPMCGVVAGLPRLAGAECLVRDIERERAAVARLESAGFVASDRANGKWRIAGRSLGMRFVAESLPALDGQGWDIIEDHEFSRERADVRVITPRIELSSTGEDWLSADILFQTNDGEILKYDEVQKMIRSVHQNTRSLGRNKWWVSGEVEEALMPLLGELDVRQENGRFRVDSRSAEVLVELCKNNRKRSEENEIRKNLDCEIPATIRAHLRPYQEAGFRWLADRVRRHGGALLADDMGLGKTLQSIALIEHLFHNISDINNAQGDRVLVVCTTSLLGNWRAEIERFAPGRKVRVLHGAGRDVERERVSAGEVILTTYATLARDLAWHLRQDYLAVVADEASLMRNPDTDHAKVLARLRAGARVALTGTPLENSVRDLWSIFRFLQPGWLGSRAEFRERYEQPLVDGDSSVARRLALKLSPFLLRRTKEHVATDLPAKWIIDEMCELSADQVAVSKGLLEQGRREVDTLLGAGSKGAARMQVLTTLLRLRQAACDLALLGNERLAELPLSRRSGKLERLLELLDEAVGGGHRVLVFSQFRTQLLAIERALADRAWPVLRLDGQTRDRQALVDRFQAADGPPVFLISLKAGGYGLNLTAADMVIHFDPWWNPAAEAQATDRAHRIGQVRPVTVYRLISRGTVEEKILRLQSKKRSLAEVIDEAGGDAANGWTTEELRKALEF